MTSVVASAATAQILTAPTALRLDEIGIVPYWSNEAPVFGDTDHDGRNEIITSRILEHQGANTYTSEYLSSFHAMAAGDFDGDGCSELLGTLNGRLALIEAVDSASYPTELRWYFKPQGVEDGQEVVILSGNGSPIQDSDRDGRPEIVTRWGSHLRVIEHFSGDEWIEVFVGEEIGGASERVTADLDGDGLLEIALGVGGSIVLYESPSDNVWKRTYTSHDTYMWNAFALEGGSDTDGNGKPELHFTGMRGVDGLSKWTTTVFESAGDDRLAEVAVLAHYDGSGGVGYNTLGNLDGVGRDEIVMEGGCCLWIYQGVAPGVWQLALEYRRAANALYSYDVNGNGKDELIWGGVLYEASPAVAVSGGRAASRVETLRLAPNPFRNETSMAIPEGMGLEASSIPAALTVYDTAGRVVHRDHLVFAPRARLRWSAGRLPPGIYWLRIDSPDGWQAAARAVVLPRGD